MMDTEQIIGNIILILVCVSLCFALVCTPLNYRAKDLHKKELILSCNGNLECIQLLLGKDNKFGY